MKEYKNNRSEIIDWVSSFLWHWEDSGRFTNEAAILIVCEVEKYLKAESQNSLSSLSDPQALLSNLEQSLNLASLYVRDDCVHESLDGKSEKHR